MAALVDLSGKRGLVIGIANDHSIAAGCAEAFRACGARLAATYLNDKAQPFVTPSAAGGGPIPAALTPTTQAERRNLPSQG